MEEVTRSSPLVRLSPQPQILAAPLSQIFILAFNPRLQILGTWWSSKASKHFYLNDCMTSLRCLRAPRIITLSENLFYSDKVSLGTPGCLQTHNLSVSTSHGLGLQMWPAVDRHSLFVHVNYTNNEFYYNILSHVCFYNAL